MKYVLLYGTDTYKISTCLRAAELHEQIKSLPPSRKRYLWRLVVGDRRKQRLCLRGQSCWGYRYFLGKESYKERFEREIQGAKRKNSFVCDHHGVRVGSMRKSESKKIWQDRLCIIASWSHCFLFKNTDICWFFLSSCTSYGVELQILWTHAGGGSVVDRSVMRLLLLWSDVIYDCSYHFLCFHFALSSEEFCSYWKQS